MILSMKILFRWVFYFSAIAAVLPVYGHGGSFVGEMGRLMFSLFFLLPALVILPLCLVRALSHIRQQKSAFGVAGLSILFSSASLLFLSVVLAVDSEVFRDAQNIFGGIIVTLLSIVVFSVGVQLWKLSSAKKS